MRGYIPQQACQDPLNEAFTVYQMKSRELRMRPYEGGELVARAEVLHNVWDGGVYGA